MDDAGIGSYGQIVKTPECDEKFCPRSVGNEATLGSGFK